MAYIVGQTSKSGDCYRSQIAERDSDEGTRLSIGELSISRLATRTRAA